MQDSKGSNKAYAEESYKYGRKVLIYILLFFTTVIAVNGVFLYFANKTFTGVVRKNYYKYGIEYNDTLHAYEEQERLGWNVELSYDEQHSKIKVKAVYPDGRAIEGAKVLSYIIRPVADGNDFKTKLEYVKDGLYTSEEIKFPMKGQWDIRVVILSDGKKYQASKRIVVE